MGYIYCITNLINNKRYVGKTTSTVQERFKEHCSDSQKERCEKRPLYDAMNQTFFGSIEAAEWCVDNGVTTSKHSASNHIIDCCNGKINSYGGYKWIYKNIPE